MADFDPDNPIESVQEIEQELRQVLGMAKASGNGERVDEAMAQLDTLEHLKSDLEALEGEQTHTFGEPNPYANKYTTWDKGVQNGRFGGGDMERRANMAGVTGITGSDVSSDTSEYARGFQHGNERFGDDGETPRANQSGGSGDGGNEYARGFQNGNDRFGDDRVADTTSDKWGSTKASGVIYRE